MQPASIINLFTQIRIQPRFNNAVRFNCELAEVLKKCGVIPDVVCKAPEVEAKVKYGKIRICPGQEMKPIEVRCSPKIQWDACCSDYYTLFMLDPDAPCRNEPTFRHWLHWLIGNIEGQDLCSGESIAEYVGAGPPEGTGLHRYVFLVYKQKEKLCFDSETKIKNNTAKDRDSFNLENFVHKYSLSKPYAGNFFHAKFDCYVPILYEQLGVSK